VIGTSPLPTADAAPESARIWHPEAAIH